MIDYKLVFFGNFKDTDPNSVMDCILKRNIDNVTIKTFYESGGPFNPVFPRPELLISNNLRILIGQERIEFQLNVKNSDELRDLYKECIEFSKKINLKLETINRIGFIKSFSLDDEEFEKFISKFVKESVILNNKNKEMSFRINFQEIDETLKCEVNKIIQLDKFEISENNFQSVITLDFNTKAGKLKFDLLNSFSVFFDSMSKFISCEDSN